MDFEAALSSLTQIPAATGEPEFPALAEDWATPRHVPVVIEAQGADKPVLDRSDRLEKLLDLSLDKAEELLNVPLDQFDENFSKVASMQKDLVVSILNTGVKVDENRFRRKSTEDLTGILRQIAEAESRLGSVPTMLAQPGS